VSGDPDKVARNRFFLIQLARLGGTLLALVGLLLWKSDRIVQGGNFAGFPITLVGLVLSFWLPQHLVRKWRTPPEPAPPES
jgi:hypothetical protein